MSTKICIVTGATGFIGQHIVSELVQAKYKVIALGAYDKAYCSIIFKEKDIKISTKPELNSAIFKDHDVQLLFGDIAQKEFICSIFDKAKELGMKIEFVLHFAACATIQEAKKNESKTWLTNYTGTENVINESLIYWQNHKETFKGFFYASTDKVYGEGSKETYHETDKLNPLPYPYDESKAKADKLVRKIAKEHNFPAVVYRFCNVYGPGDYHQSRLVPGTMLCLAIKKAQPLLKIYKDKSGNVQSFYRDMIYVKDLTNAILMMLAYIRKGENLNKVFGEVFNLGTDNCYAIDDVINKITLFYGKSITPRIEEVNQGEIKKQCMNYAKLNKLLGFKPRYDLEQGLKETVDWYQKHKGEIDGKFI